MPAAFRLRLRKFKDDVKLCRDRRRFAPTPYPNLRPNDPIPKNLGPETPAPRARCPRGATAPLVARGHALGVVNINRLVCIVHQNALVTLDPIVVAAHFLFYDANPRCIEGQVRRFVEENCRRNAALIQNLHQQDAQGPPAVMTACDYEIVELRWI